MLRTEYEAQVVNWEKQDMTCITHASGNKCQEDTCSSSGSASSDLVFRSYVGLNCSFLS